MNNNGAARAMVQRGQIKRTARRSAGAALLAFAMWLGFAPAMAAPPVRAPDTTITSAPVSPTNATTASFVFTSTVSGSTFQCQLDSAALTTCTSPASYSGLAAGNHSFNVRATANGLTDSSPDTASWTVDLAAPSVPANLRATAGAGSVALAWNASTDNVAVAGYVVYRNGTRVGTGTTTTSTSYTDASLASGTYSYTVAAVDTAGNASAQSTAASATIAGAPDTTITSSPTSPTNATTASLAFTSTAGGSTFQCQLDGGQLKACTSPTSYTGLAAGSHAFNVRATANGQTDPSPATASWTVDLTAPSVPTNLTATASTSSVALTWNASTDNTAVAGYVVYRNGTRIGTGTTTTSTSYTDASLATGNYSYTVAALDGVGNLSGQSTAATATIGVAPDTTITATIPAVTNQTTASFTFTATVSGSTFECQLDATAYAACTSPRSYTGLAAGSHTFRVRATASGITDSTPAQLTWTVDTTLPSTPTGLTVTVASTTSLSVRWNASTDTSGIASYTLTRNGTAIPNLTTTTYTDSGLTTGTAYSYTVTAVDNAGNSSTASAPVTGTPATLDTVIDTGPAPYATSPNASLTFHATMAPATFTCKLDAGAATACLSPIKYTKLATGSHTVTVTATSNGVTDPTPATWTWIVDTTPPTTPTGLAADASVFSAVHLTWTASTDTTSGIAGYNVYRDTLLLASTTGPDPTFTDASGTLGTSYSYTVRARDGAGNLSALSAAVSAAPAAATWAPQLTRYPYLTDLVGKSVLVNFATDRSASTASVKVGTTTSSVCSLDSGQTPIQTVTATRITITVNAVVEYQWKAKVTFPAVGTYCYRPFLSTTDLLSTAKAPTVRTQVATGDSGPWSFAVFGDFGEVDGNGDNANAAKLMNQVASSGARFAVTVGDNAYPAGSQGNYGDLQQKGAATSAVFGPDFWTRVGASMPMFATTGNHGFARSDAVHPQFGNWPQDSAVATSGGSQTMTSYPSIDGSNVASYPDLWYAFDAGNVRFYVLTAAWADLNGGTNNDPYAVEAKAHWSTSSPEYQWLAADLAAHKSNVKLGFFHYPLYSDQPSESSDDALRGTLGTLLASNGVSLAFNGHAHIYQRNTPAANLPNLTTYVTGGGGGAAQSTGACAANDAYAIGWSSTNSAGTACGAASPPAAEANVYHFLKVTVEGSKITVTPTDSTGRTFDQQVYSLSSLPETYLDTTPPAGTTSTSATFTYHASSASATYACTLDAGTATSCPGTGATYTGLSQGTHTFTVVASVGGVSDPQPASYTWVVDTTAPSVPGSFAVTSPTAFSAALTWSASTDNTGVTGYDVLRNGAVIASLGAVTRYTDTTVVAGTTYQYAVRVKDIAGNTATTATVSVTTGTAATPVFADGFESGDLASWGTRNGISVVTSPVAHGTYAARGTPTGSDPATGTAGTSAYVKKTLATTYPDAWTTLSFNVLSGPDQANLLRLRDAAGGSLGYVFVSATGQLGLRNDNLGQSLTSATSVTSG
ncbi:MAG: metallophosphoesterase, partial [Friedmanniella sp.]|nr:metallophosphoesterase [Friedmanniella sp.]